MEQSRKKMKFEFLFERYFSNFPRIILTNLIFFVPLFAALSVYYFIMSFDNLLLSVMSSIPLVAFVFPFFAGVVIVTRNIARGDESIKVFKTFKKGVKDNFKEFFLYGFLASLVFVFSYFSISIYAKMLSQSWLFYVAMFVCILIDLAVLFIFFYVPLMTVTFDLSLKHIFKNSFLMSFGEIKNNLFALLSLVVVLAVCFTLVAFATQELLVIIITLLIFALILPATAQYAVSFYVFDDMYDSIAMREEKSKNLDSMIADAKAKKNGEAVVDNTDYSDVDISTLKDTDDFIFYNGKMMKQSELLKRVLAQREENKPE